MSISVVFRVVNFIRDMMNTHVGSELLVPVVAGISFNVNSYHCWRVHEDPHRECFSDALSPKCGES